LLDQARTVAAKLTVSEVRSMLGLAPDEAVTSLITDTESGDSAALVTHLQQLRDQGLEAAQLAKQLSATWRAQLLDHTSALAASQLLSLLGRLLNVGSSSDPFSLLEIILLEIAMSITPQAPQPQLSTPIAAELAPIPAAPKPKAAESVAPAADSNFETTVWPKLLETIKQTHNTLYGIVRMAKPHFADNTLTMSFRFAFHQKRVNEPNNKKVIATVLHELLGRKITIVCELDANVEPPKPPAEPGPVTDPALETISNIFGGGELLESENQT
jgi:hypothetical protein